MNRFANKTSCSPAPAAKPKAPSSPPPSPARALFVNLDVTSEDAWTQAVQTAEQWAVPVGPQRPAHRPRSLRLPAHRLALLNPMLLS
jgi:hypothetical protein